MEGLVSSSRTAKSTLSLDVVSEVQIGVVGVLSLVCSSDKSNPKIPSCLAHR